MKRHILILIIIITLISTFSYGEGYVDDDFVTYTERGTVIEATKVIESTVDDFEVQIQYVMLKITSGKYKDEVVEIENGLSNNEIYDIIVKPGDNVVLIIDEYDDGHIDVFISDYYRSNYIVYLLILFIGLVIFIGKGKGVKAVLSLSFTVFSVLKILLPFMLKGVNPIPLSILISIIVTIVTIFLVSGVNYKSISAIIGTTVGVVIAGGISYFVGNQIHLTGLSAEEATHLMYIPQEIIFNFRNLLFAGIILGSLGAIMDVGMSISSSIEEIHNANNSLSRKELFSSGMNVGKDVMGTMTNTLILAYTGSSIPLLLVFMAYETSLTKIFNLDIIATEIIRSLSGSIGLVMTIPITALIASFLIKKNIEGDENNGII